jgi:hypothetical protein
VSFELLLNVDRCQKTYFLRTGHTDRLVKKENMPSVGYFRAHGVDNASIYLVCTSKQSESPSQRNKPTPSAKQGMRFAFGSNARLSNLSKLA